MIEILRLSTPCTARSRRPTDAGAATSQSWETAAATAPGVFVVQSRVRAQTQAYNECCNFVLVH